ncbi:MAG: PIN domain-containing protein [Candidatus Cloacimonetes bacterium]|nr:PIN domain-containing protein [Candidatus Cloacimonadota bacterium]
MIFLDTDIISYHLSSNLVVYKHLVDHTKNYVNIGTTVINVYEILKGLRWRNNRTKAERLEDLLKIVKVFSIDDEVIEIASTIYGRLRIIGSTIGDADILIAAIVIRNKGTLITNNTKHFEKIESLNIENWI